MINNKTLSTRSDVPAMFSIVCTESSWLDWPVTIRVDMYFVVCVFQKTQPNSLTPTLQNFEACCFIKRFNQLLQVSQISDLNACRDNKLVFLIKFYGYLLVSFFSTQWTSITGDRISTRHDFTSKPYCKQVLWKSLENTLIHTW